MSCLGQRPVTIGEQTASPTDLRGCSQSHWQSSRTPIAAFVFKTSGDFVTARATSTVLNVPFAQLVPIALDEKLTATGTPCASACGIVDVSRVHVVQAL